MRILIVNIYFHPDPTGTGWVLTELARDLAAQGHAVTVITSVPHYALPENRGQSSPRPPCVGYPVLVAFGRPAAPRRKGDGPGGANAGHRTSPLGRCFPWREEWMDDIRVIRTAIYVPHRKTLWSRLLNYVSFSALAIAAGLRSGAHDVLLCTSPPLSIGFSAWLLSKFKRIPFVFNVQDIYPDAAVLMGMIRKGPLLVLSQTLERFIYRMASLVTVISGDAKANLQAKGIPESKIRVIPNWVDVQEIQPGEARNEFRASVLQPNTQPRTPNTHLIMFAGNIGLIAGLQTVLEAAAALQHRPDIHFVLVGEGTAKAELVAQANRMKLRNLTFLPTQPRALFPQVLAAADVHLVTLKRRMSMTSVPSKSYTIMASGRPILAAVDPGSEIWRLVETADAGLCVPPEEPVALAQAIEALCDSPDRRRVMGDNARAYVVQHHSKTELTAVYGATLAAVAKKRTVRGEGAAVGEGRSILTPDP